MLRRPSLRYLVTSIVFVAAFHALPIIAWGGIGGFFAHPARACLLAASFIAAIACSFSGMNTAKNSKCGAPKDRWVIVSSSLIMAALFILPAYLDSRNIWTFDGDAVRYLGLVVFLVGAALRTWTMFALSWRFSVLVTIQKDHTLVTDGIYRFIRHPSYLGIMVRMVGWALVFRSVPGLVLAALMVPVYRARMNAEEALLAEHFGSEYAEYRARTWRLIPYLY